MKKLALAAAALVAGLAMTACTGPASPGPSIHGHASIVRAPTAVASSARDPFAGTLTVDRRAEAEAPRTVLKAHACAGMEGPALAEVRTVKL